MKLLGVICFGLMVCSIAAAERAGSRRLLSTQMVVDPLGKSTTVPGVTTKTNIGPVQANDPDNSSLPQQVHLTYWKLPNQMLVSFVSGLPILASGPVTSADLPSLDVVAYVRYGTSPGAYTNTQTSNKAYAYIQNNNWAALGDRVASTFLQGYVSARIHHVLLTGLEFGTKYYYQVAANATGPWSSELSFTTLSHKPIFPFRIGYMGDVGNSDNSTVTVDRLFANNPQFVSDLGDISYADTYAPNGSYADPYYTKILATLKYRLSYQPAWDQHANMLQKLASSVPVAVIPGNHELEFQPDGTVFAAYNTRFPVPQKDGPPRIQPLTMPTDGQPLADPVNMFYSVDIPGVAHMVYISNYIPYDTWGTDSVQYKWLAADLSKVNRKATPWLIVHMHAPLVTTWVGGFKAAECMRLTYEPLMFQYGVDLFFNGHAHAYERTYPTYNYTTNECGITYITIGTGGKPGTPGSALDTDVIDAAKICPASPYNDTKVWVAKQAANPTIFGPVGNCPTVQPDLGGFCWNISQPAFSAYRTAAFGHGTLDILNETHAVWAFWENSQAPNVSMDKVTLNRGQPATCASAMGVRG